VKRKKKDEIKIDDPPQPGDTGDSTQPPDAEGGPRKTKEESHEEKPLDLDEVQQVTGDAFNEAYDHYKKHAVGDPKTREEHLSKLRNELVEYTDNEDGTKNVTRGLLKNFTDENYQNALAAGTNAMNATLKQLGEGKYPDFQAFKLAREKSAANLHAQLQKNVAYPEISERFLKGLEELSTKMQMKFNVTSVEKEKEQLLTQKARKGVEQEKRNVELQRALGTSQQIKTNTESEKRLLAEQNEKQAREWKERIDLESKMREQQIIADLQGGFDDRAERLKAELAASQQQTMHMMMQLQKENQEQQAKMAQFLTLHAKQQQQIPIPQEPRRGGLLSGILGAVDDILGRLI